MSGVGGLVGWLENPLYKVVHRAINPRSALETSTTLTQAIDRCSSYSIRAFGAASEKLLRLQRSSKHGPASLLPTRYPRKVSERERENRVKGNYGSDGTRGHSTACATAKSGYTTKVQAQKKTNR